MIFILEDNDERIAAFAAELGDAAHHIERTVPESIAWLEAHAAEVDLYSLDNDLYVPSYEGEEGEGWQLLEWLIASAPKRPVITHTTNSHAATKMQLACADAGWDLCRIVPFDYNRWIAASWIAAVREWLSSSS